MERSIYIFNTRAISDFGEICQNTLGPALLSPFTPFPQKGEKNITYLETQTFFSCLQNGFWCKVICRKDIQMLVFWRVVLEAAVDFVFISLNLTGSQYWHRLQKLNAKGFRWEPEMVYQDVDTILNLLCCCLNVQGGAGKKLGCVYVCVRFCLASLFICKDAIEIHLS